MLSDIVSLRKRDDLERLRAVVRDASRASNLEYSASLDLLIIASELGRNVLVHGGGGDVSVEETPGGVRLCFRDHGPGIAHLDEAMRGGVSSVGTCGRGLSASKRLSDEFEILTGADGTTITVRKNRRRR